MRRLVQTLSPYHPRLRDLPEDLPFIWDEATLRNGTIFTLTTDLPAGELWMGTQPRNVPNGSEGWIVKVDRRTGKLLGAMQSGGTHSVEIDAQGQALTGVRPDKVVWFRR